jgi:hypothetical protein
MHYFVTVLTYSGDLYPTFLQKIDFVGRIAVHENPVTAPAFYSSHLRIEAMHSFLTHSAQQFEPACNTHSRKIVSKSH